MNYYLINTIHAYKKIVQLIKKDVLKHPIINFYNEQHSKRVLISYITNPFRKGIDLSHTNSSEVLEIANVFRSLSYVIDIADYNYEGFIDYKMYDVIIGFGEPLVNSFNFKTKANIKRIYYGTGMHILLQNYNSLLRIEDVKKKKGVWITKSGRVVEKAWSEQTTIVDAMILLGNEEVKMSYQKYFSKDIYLLKPSFHHLFNYQEILANKNFKEAKKNYLWFGSSGLVHKGLDLLLDTFKSLPNLNLHICGPIENESEFKEAYYNELYKTANIKSYGFINIDSQTFKELIQKCGFVIYPSCSEGGGAAILNVCGNGGLIPILTKEASIDVDDFGFIIKAFEDSAIKTAIDSSQSLSEVEMKIRSNNSGSKFSYYSISKYKEQLKAYLELILNK